jgi:hypothetical protein
MKLNNYMPMRACTYGSEAIMKNALQAVLDKAAPDARTSPAGPEKFYRPSREGKRLIAGHFDPSTAKRLKLLAAEEETTVQALLEEALELLFDKRSRRR